MTGTPDTGSWPPKDAPRTEAQRAAGGWPPQGWPSMPQLVYTKELITVVLLIVALPWLLTKLTRNPAAVLGGVKAARV